MPISGKVDLLLPTLHTEKIRQVFYFKRPPASTCMLEKCLNHKPIKFADLEGRLKWKFHFLFYYLNVSYNAYFINVVRY